MIPNKQEVKDIAKDLHSFDEHELGELRVKNKDIQRKVVDKECIEAVDERDGNFECKICYVECPIEQIMYLNCGHYFCRECFAGYFEYLIKNNKVYGIKCPNKDCGTTVNE